MTGQELRAIRHAAGLTQRAFAEAIGLRPNSLARIERGERPVTAQVLAAVRLFRFVYRLRVPSPTLDSSQTPVVLVESATVAAAAQGSHGQERTLATFEERTRRIVGNYVDPVLHEAHRTLQLFAAEVESRGETLDQSWAVLVRLVREEIEFRAAEDSREEAIHAGF